MPLYGVFDWEGDVVDDHHGYRTSTEADEALGYWERGNRGTYDGVYAGRQCGCAHGAIVHAYDSSVCPTSDDA